MSTINYHPKMLELLECLRRLPPSLSDHPSIYPFSNLVLEPNDVEFYGSPQGALDHRLQLIFGSRVDGQPIKLKGQGQGLEAVVDILHRHITGEGEENVLLWKWVDDLLRAAKEYNETPNANVETTVGRKRRAPAKDAHTSVRKRRKKVPRTQVDAAKAKTAIKWPHNPADLEDDSIGAHTSGHPQALDVDGLAQSHALRSGFFDMPKDVWDSMPLFVKKSLNEGRCYDDTMDDAEAIQLKTEKVNHTLLQLICDRMLVPSIVDCEKWHNFVHALDANITTASGSTVADNFVMTEAAYIRNKSVEKLSKLSNLTLSFDGGTTRGGESIYTVHATDPATREAYLIEGNEASGVSHT
ncbi:hypothetical protein FRC06_005913, partial [Ceratobasidium sp. 370]